MAIQYAVLMGLAIIIEGLAVLLQAPWTVCAAFGVCCVVAALMAGLAQEE